MDVLLVGEIGDGTGDAEDLVVSPGGQAEFGKGLFEKLFAGVVELAMFSHKFGSHSGVKHGAIISEAYLLNLASLNDLLAQGFAVAAVVAAAQLAIRDRRDFDVDVDAVDKRAADPREVFVDLIWRTLARFVGIGEVATGARIHGGYEHEPGGELD